MLASQMAERIRCNVFIISSVFDLASTEGSETRKKRPATKRTSLDWGAYTNGLYCLAKAHSATSDLSLMLGSAIIVVLGFRAVSKRMIGAYIAAAVVVLGLAQATFDIYGK